MFKDLFTNYKKLILVLVGVMILVVVMVFVIMGLFNKNESNTFKKEYEKLNNVATEDGKKYPRVTISDDNIMKYVSYDEVLDVFNNNGDAVIYLGYAKCLYCRSAVQVLLDTAETTQLKEIYYLDVEKKGDKYDQLLTTLGDNFVVEENGDKKVYSPLVLFVAKGKIVSYNKGTLFSQEDPYTELDKSQVKGLSEIYAYGIRDVLESMNYSSN